MHNVSLPTHRYVWVYTAGINGQIGHMPAVWFGVSSTPGRALGCHVLLENGAMVAELPLSWLHWPHGEESGRGYVADPDVLGDVARCQAWDCFGLDMTVTEFEYLGLLTARLLDEKHQQVPDIWGQCWFTIDWVRNGYSDYPEQHKLLHLLACSDGSLRLLPTDRILWEDKSFTAIDGVPKIMRQTKEWSVE